ncbi:MAG: YajQ family cyclic di-GMP-binding protein [Balneolaceae bacterium]|nr:YajQ family cyclic di-GMP-binding protein [Balneolaceae bacterium]
MASFDIVNKLDLQEIDNAVNNTRKEVQNRYDFRGTHTEINLNKKEMKIHLSAPDRMKLNAVREMLVRNLIKRGISPKALDIPRKESTPQDAVKIEINLNEGIDKEQAKEIVKQIKNLGLKVTPAIQGEQVRVTGKKIDDLQRVQQHLKKLDLPIPLQFVNLKR